MPALERCVGDAGHFFDKHWGQSPLLRGPAEENDDAFDDLASLDDLDHMVASLGLRASNLRMVRAGKTLPVSSYATQAGKRSGAGDALISAPLVYERFSQGATIVLESLHRYWQPLTDFCRELELSIGHRLQVNAYVTPPGSQGFNVHRDEHDVFVLQVSGDKHWIVYDREDDELVLIDESIERGSALYIPKGFPHAAAAGRAASAHLTIGILTHDSIDVVREIAKLAEESPLFEERLPRESARDTAVLRATVEECLAKMRSWLDGVDVDELTERVARRVMSTAQPIIRGQLRQLELLEAIEEETELARRRGAVCYLFRRDAALNVLLSDRELTMPLAAEGAMREIARRDRLCARDLHEFLTPESSLVLVRRLIREGLLEVVVAG